MAVLEVSVDDKLKNNSDELFTDLGLDTSTAIRIFLKAAQEYNGFPFPVNRLAGDSELLKMHACTVIYLARIKLPKKL